MSALMSDVIAARLTPGVINAACNAGGKLLRMVELEQRHRSGQMRREPMPLAQLGPVPEP